MNASRPLMIGFATLLSACGGNELGNTTLSQPVAQSALANSTTSYAEKTLLPSDFTVYVSGNTVINWPAPGFEARTFPTVNDVKTVPGCYVACYTRDAAHGVYEIEPGIYVAGQTRVQGRYQGTVCRPTGYETADISAADEFAELCSGALPDTCADSTCWAGGDTGGWFGL